MFSISYQFNITIWLQVYVSIFKGNAEQVYVHFDVSGGDDQRSTFYAYAYLHASSYTDLSSYQDCIVDPPNGGTIFSIEGYVSYLTFA